MYRRNCKFFKYIGCLSKSSATISFNQHYTDLVLSRQPMSFRYHNRAALVMSALQVEKNPLCAPGPCTPVGVHSNYTIPRWRLPAHAIHAALTLSPPRGVRPAPNSPKMKLRFNYIFIVSVSHHPVWMLNVDIVSCDNLKKISDKKYCFFLHC